MKRRKIAKIHTGFPHSGHRSLSKYRSRYPQLAQQCRLINAVCACSIDMAIQATDKMSRSIQAIIEGSRPPKKISVSSASTKTSTPIARNFHVGQSRRYFPTVVRTSSTSRTLHVMEKRISKRVAWCVIARPSEWKDWRIDTSRLYQQFPSLRFRPVSRGLKNRCES